MRRYVAQGRYMSERDGQLFGPWSEGTVVVLGAEDAEWVNRSSPGILVLEEPEPEETEPDDNGANENGGAEDEKAEATPAKQARNRQHRPKATRA